jgi:parallel beta-helix repeat protein
MHSKGPVAQRRSTERPIRFCNGWGGTARLLGLLVIIGGLGIDLAGQATPAPPPNVRLVKGEEPFAGPRPSITCPPDAVDVWPGARIQTVVNGFPGKSTFCIRAGIHYVTSAVTPKTGNTFVGEYGAILDGSQWITTDSTQAAFRAHNQDIDDVTIRNLVIRNMPQKGIHAFYWMSDRWTIEYNEITGTHTGINAPNDAVIRRNYIHRNVRNPASSNPAERGGGYAANRARNVLFEANEISYNGPEQKVTQTTNVIFRNNFVHHNDTGIWYDGDNVGAIIEGNRVEDNTGDGIFYEISGQGIIRDNIVRRSGDSALFVSTSRDLEIYGNTFEHNYRAVNLFVSCAAVDMTYPGAIGFDLRNNLVRDNHVVVGSRSGAIGNLLSADGTCTAARAAPYLNGEKGNVFRDNRYAVASLTGRWWFWGGWKTWSEWQGLGQDLSGTVSQ